MRFQPPTILRVKTHVLVAAVERLKLALIVLAGNSEQEVGEVQSRLRSEKQEAAIKLSGGIDVDLIVMEFAAYFDGMSSCDFGKVVEDLKSVVELLQLICVGSEIKAVEADALHTFRFRRQRHDARSSGAHGETLRRQAYADPSHGFAQIICVAQITEAEFIHCRRAQRFRVAKVKQLRATGVESVETRDVRSALRDWVRIVLGPIVQKIVCGQQSPVRVGIQPIGTLVVAQRLIESRSGESAV